MWTYRGQEFTVDQIGSYFGFVYLILDTVTGKLYIGQKRFFFTKTLPPLKSSGSKRKRRVTYLSDWITYHGSNRTLQQLVSENQDPLRFRREILHLCMNASEMNYIETREIFSRNALLSPQYFNEYVQCRINANSVKNLQIK